MLVDVAREGEQFSDQLLRLLAAVEDEHVVLLKDDFYLLEPVKTRLYGDLVSLARRNPQFARVSLQCVDEGYRDSSEEAGNIGDEKLFMLKPRADYLASFEASIWRTDVLRRFTVPGESHRDVETQMTQRMRDEVEIIVPETRVLTYKDAMRGGEARIRIEKNGRVMLMVPDGWKYTEVVL